MNRFYEGHYPVLVTSDLEIIDEVFFRQFANFSGRRVNSIMKKIKIFLS